MRSGLRPLVAEAFDSSCVGPRSPKPVPDRFPQQLGEIVGRHARGKPPHPYHAVRAVDHEGQAALRSIPRSDTGKVGRPAPIRFGYVPAPVVSPPRPDDAAPTGREPPRRRSTRHPVWGLHATPRRLSRAGIRR